MLGSGARLAEDGLNYNPLFYLKVGRLGVVLVPAFLHFKQISIGKKFRKNPIYHFCQIAKTPASAVSTKGETLPRTTADCDLDDENARHNDENARHNDEDARHDDENARHDFENAGHDDENSSTESVEALSDNQVNDMLPYATEDAGNRFGSNENFLSENEKNEEGDEDSDPCTCSNEVKYF